MKLVRLSDLTDNVLDFARGRPSGGITLNADARSFMTRDADLNSYSAASSFDGLAASRIANIT